MTKPVGKPRIADRTGKYALGGNTGGQQILKAEPLNPEKPDDTVQPFNPNGFR